MLTHPCITLRTNLLDHEAWCINMLVCWCFVEDFCVYSVGILASNSLFLCVIIDFGIRVTLSLMK